MKPSYIAVGLFVAMGVCSASAQDFNATERSGIIDNVIDQLITRYVDPNLGQKAAQTIRQKKEKQAYDALDTKAALIEAGYNPDTYFSRAIFSRSVLGNGMAQ